MRYVKIAYTVLVTFTVIFFYYRVVEEIAESASVGSRDFKTACIETNRSISRKELTIYANQKVDTSISTGDKEFFFLKRPYSIYKKADDYTVIVIIDDELIENREFNGGYPMHINSLTLNAAAAIGGHNSDLFNCVSSLLLEYCPDFFWSSPEHGLMTIKEICNIKDSNHAFFINETEQWKWRSKLTPVDKSAELNKRL